MEPKCFKLPEHRDELRNYMLEHPETFWIAKPSMEDTGCGIVILKSAEELDDETLVSPHKEYVVQLYINDPMTISDAKRKVDYRVAFCEIVRDGKTHIYFNTKSQARAAPDPYKPLRKDDDNKDRSSHITFCLDIFENGKYHLTEDTSIVNDTYNFMCFDAVANWYEENGQPGWREKALEIFEDHVLQHKTLHAPAMKFAYEFVGKGLQMEHGFDYFTFWGNDVLLSEDYTPSWVESNIAASNGDRAEDNPDCGFPVSPCFQLWGVECFHLWLAAANDHKGFIERERIENYKKVYTEGEENYKYQKEEDVLLKIIDLWLWITTGTTEMKPAQPGLHYDRFPTKMTVENAYK